MTIITTIIIFYCFYCFYLNYLKMTFKKLSLKQNAPLEGRIVPNQSLSLITFAV